MFCNCVCFSFLWSMTWSPNNRHTFPSIWSCVDGTSQSVEIKCGNKAGASAHTAGRPPGTGGAGSDGGRERLLWLIADFFISVTDDGRCV